MLHDILCSHIVHWHLSIMDDISHTHPIHRITPQRLVDSDTSAKGDLHHPAKKSVNFDTIVGDGQSDYSRGGSDGDVAFEDKSNMSWLYSAT